MVVPDSFLSLRALSSLMLLVIYQGLREVLHL